MNILAVMAHASDAAFFCSGTLMKYKQAGHDVHIAVTTGQDSPWGAKEMDAEVRLLNFEHGNLHDTRTSRSAILTAMRWAEADVILTHSIWDPDPDRAHTGKLVTSSLLSMNGKLHPSDLPPVNKRPQLFYTDTMAGLTLENDYGISRYRVTEQTFYLTSGVHSNDWHEPESYVSLDAFMDRKLQILAVDPVLAEGCRAQCRIRGIQMGCRYAEAFSGHRGTGRIADYRLLP